MILPPLPLRLLAEDLEIRFQPGQRLTFREKGGRFACEVVSVLDEFRAEIGIWYVVKFEGSDELTQMPQHTLCLSRAEQAALRLSVASHAEQEVPVPPKKRLSSTRTPKKNLTRKPTYTEALDSEEFEPMYSESEISCGPQDRSTTGAPRIRRSSLSDRPLSSDSSASESGSEGSEDSWLVQDLVDSPEPKRLRKISENIPPVSLAEEDQTENKDNVEKKAKKVKKNSKVEFPIQTGAKFVHRSAQGSIECELIGKFKDEQGCWFYEIQYEAGKAVKNVPAWRLEKADIMSAYRAMEAEDSLPVDGPMEQQVTWTSPPRGVPVTRGAEKTRTSMDPDECMEWIDAEVRGGLHRCWDTELPKASLESWLEGAVNWAVERVAAKNRLPQTLKVLGRIGFFFQKKKSVPVHFLHLAEEVYGDFDLLNSTNVSLAVRGAFGLALGEVAECGLAALRDALKTEIFPRSETRESREAWQLAGLLLTLSCKKTSAGGRGKLCAAYLTALPIFFLEDARGREFVLGVLASVASAGLPEFPIIPGKTDAALLVPTAVDVLRRAEPDFGTSEVEEVEAAWKFIALVAGSRKFPERDDMQKLGWFGWSREDERSQACSLRGYGNFNFQEARSRKLQDDRARGVRLEYDEWKEARLLEISERKKRKPDPFLVFWKREKEPILIGGTSFFEDKFAVDDEDIYDVWVRRKVWASEIASKIYQALPDSFPHKAASLMYLAECRRLLMKSVVREALDVDRTAVTDSAVYVCIKKGVVPALKYILSTVDPTLAAVYASQLL